MRTDDGIAYLPIYHSMFIAGNSTSEDDTIVPEVTMSEMDSVKSETLKPETLTPLETFLF